MAHPSALAIQDSRDFLFGISPRPLRSHRGVEIGAGEVVPEVNFTLPTIEITEGNWSLIRTEYRQTIDSICHRAIELETPSLLVEFEALPPMTVEPKWGIELTELLLERIDAFRDSHGLVAGLRLTPNDIRELRRPPQMRAGIYWEKMLEFFEGGVHAGADFLAIESTGGKEVHDEALMMADIRGIFFGLAVLAPRDMRFLWKAITEASEGGETIPSGDTACGFANTAMALADRRMIPKVLAAWIRVLSVPRDLVAYDCGAKGPSKDCAYEGPYLKAIAGVPISMEGRTASCAHQSAVGNVAQAVCDCWSNESVQMVQLLSGPAPTVSLEQLVYDCRLMNIMRDQPRENALWFRDCLADSDAGLDPQAWVLHPEVVLRLSDKISTGANAYQQARIAATVTCEELKQAADLGRLKLTERERRWLEKLSHESQDLPESEDSLIEEMLRSDYRARFLPQEYGIEG